MKIIHAVATIFCIAGTLFSEEIPSYRYINQLTKEVNRSKVQFAHLKYTMENLKKIDELKKLGDDILAKNPQIIPENGEMTEEISKFISLNEPHYRRFTVGMKFNNDDWVKIKRVVNGYIERAHSDYKEANLKCQEDIEMCNQGFDRILSAVSNLVSNTINKK